MSEWLSEAKALDSAVYAAVAASETPRLDGAMRRLSGAADHGKLWFADGGRAGPPRWAGRPACGRDAGSSHSASPRRSPTSSPSRWARGGGRQEQESEELARRHVQMPRSSSFPSGHTASAFAFATGAGERPAAALGAAAGDRDAGRLLASPYRCALPGRRPRGRVHRGQRGRAGRAAAGPLGARESSNRRRAPRQEVPFRRSFENDLDRQSPMGRWSHVESRVRRRDAEPSRGARLVAPGGLDDDPVRGGTGVDRRLCGIRPLGVISMAGRATRCDRPGHGLGDPDLPSLHPGPFDRLYGLHADHLAIPRPVSRSAQWPMAGGRVASGDGGDRRPE